MGQYIVFLMIIRQQVHAHHFTLLQDESQKPENANVIFLKVDVDEAKVRVPVLYLEICCRYRDLQSTL